MVTPKKVLTTKSPNIQVELGLLLPGSAKTNKIPGQGFIWKLFLFTYFLVALSLLTLLVLSFCIVCEQLLGKKTASDSQSSLVPLNITLGCVPSMVWHSEYILWPTPSATPCQRPQSPKIGKPLRKSSCTSSSFESDLTALNMCQYTQVVYFFKLRYYLTSKSTTDETSQANEMPKTSECLSVARVYHYYCESNEPAFFLDSINIEDGMFHSVIATSPLEDDSKLDEVDATTPTSSLEDDPKLDEMDATTSPLEDDPKLDEMDDTTLMLFKMEASRNVTTSSTNDKKKNEIKINSQDWMNILTVFARAAANMTAKTAKSIFDN